MAIYHLAVKHASRHQGRSALAHATYIAREGPYAYGHFAEQFVQVEHRNMPAWAQDRPFAFWAAADTHERANGRLYTELEIALPRELSRPEHVTLARSFVEHQIGTAHPCSWALHVSRALDGGDQPHVHVMVSERTHDGIDRDPALFFKRANAADPARGGAAKDPAWNHRDKVEALREAWATTANQALERAGFSLRLDHRSLAAQGLARTPEPKLGPAQTAMLRRGLLTEQGAQVLDLRQYRERLQRVEQAVERTEARIIDLMQVQAQREAQEQARAAQQVQREAPERERAAPQAQRDAQEREQGAQRAQEEARIERLIERETAWRAAQEAAQVERLLARLGTEDRLTGLLQRQEAWHAERLDQARQQLEQTTGQAHPFAEAERVAGRLVGRVELAGQDFGRVQSRDGTMVLVPWREDMTPHLRQAVAIQLDAQRHVSRVLGQAPGLEREQGLDRGG